jgi:hypothetical protein
MLDSRRRSRQRWGMSTTPDQEANMPHQPPSRKQLNYLKALADRTGQTFEWPHSSRCQPGDPAVEEHPAEI